MLQPVNKNLISDNGKDKFLIIEGGVIGEQKKLFDLANSYCNDFVKNTCDIFDVEAIENFDNSIHNDNYCIVIARKISSLYKEFTGKNSIIKTLLDTFNAVTPDDTDEGKIKGWKIINENLNKIFSENLELLNQILSSKNKKETEKLLIKFETMLFTNNIQTQINKIMSWGKLN